MPVYFYIYQMTSYYLKRYVRVIFLSGSFFIGGKILGQSYSPITVTGFNHDVVAEAGTSSLTTTTIALDAVPASNRVMYTNAFRIANGFGGGGLPDNGLITNAGDNYQLASYTANNALLLQRTESGDLTLVTPSKFSSIRVLAFTTEGISLVNIKLYFTDGSVSNVLTNYALPDWFNNGTNLVLSGFGRCSRATPASSPDAYPTNPRMYYINIPIACPDRLKTLERINFTNVTTGGSNAPYPNTVLLGVSGLTNNPSILANITHAGCTVNGSVILTISGITMPYTITWNTVPVQTGPTATNLAPGNYTATITDAGGCDTIFPVTIQLINNLVMTTHVDTIICAGSSFNANTVSNAVFYSWTPLTGVSNPAIVSPVITPVATTTYTVTGTTGACTISKSFTVSFLPKAVAKFGYTINPCSNDPVQFHDSSFIAGGNINQWNWIYNGSVFSTQQNPVRAFPQGTHTVGLVVNGAGGCASDTVFKTFTINTRPGITMNFTDACKLTPVVFTAAETTATGINSWNWNFGDGATATGIPVQHSYTSVGSYPVKLYALSTNGCSSDTLLAYITIYGTNAFAGNDTTVAAGQPIQLNASGGINYTWSPATGLNNPFISNPIAILTRTQTYELKAYTPAGCETYDTITIKVSDLPEIYLPGAFTPDGNSLNDVYRALPVGIKDFRFMKIFNRFGQEIFSTTDYHNGWDGTFKGKKQGSGVYVVIAYGVGYNGYVVDKKQTLVLIR